MVEYVLSSSPGDKMDGRYRNGGYVSKASDLNREAYLVCSNFMSHSLTSYLFVYEYRVEEMLTKTGERRAIPKKKCPLMRRTRAQR